MPAADLIENDQRARAGLIEDGGSFDHLDHEGRAPAGEIVGGADAREQPVDDADMRAARRNEAAHLREDRDQRVLPQERGFARHVGTGDQPDAAGVRSVGRRSRIVGDGLPSAAQSLLDHGCRPPSTTKAWLSSTCGRT